jgi:uridine phosphorylase
MTRSAWYIGCREDEVGEAAILVGDRGRIDRIAEHLESAHFVEENRGLRTVTGVRAGRRITVSAFGMGGPIAAIVLHELFDLGVRNFLRIGTAMVMPPAKLGDFVLADGGVRGEGTSRTYAPIGYPAIADFDLGAALRAAGLIATDMETATLLTAGRVLGARAASFCLGTVDGLTQEKIGAAELEAQERKMFEIALDAIVASLSA